MNDTVIAIQEFEDNLYHESLKPTISDKSKIIALKALQEKAEREKGCPFCCYTEYPDKTLYPKDGYLFYAGYSKQIAPDDFHEEEIEDIKICPMCGRRLGESNG